MSNYHEFIFDTPTFFKTNMYEPDHGTITFYAGSVVLKKRNYSKDTRPIMIRNFEEMARKSKSLCKFYYDIIPNITTK